MVERQLEQGFAFAGTQRQGYFHFPLSVGDALRKQVSIQLQRITYYAWLRPCAPHRYSGPRGVATWTSPFASGRQVPKFRTSA
jgi:hypothetical protein